MDVFVQRWSASAQDRSVIIYDGVRDGERDCEREDGLEEPDSPFAAWRRIRSLRRSLSANSRISSSRFTLSCSTFCSFSFSARLSALYCLLRAACILRFKRSCGVNVFLVAPVLVPLEPVTVETEGLGVEYEDAEILDDGVNSVSDRDKSESLFCRP